MNIGNRWGSPLYIGHAALQQDVNSDITSTGGRHCQPLHVQHPVLLLRSLVRPVLAIIVLVLTTRDLEMEGMHHVWSCREQEHSLMHLFQVTVQGVLLRRRELGTAQQQIVGSVPTPKDARDRGTWTWLQWPNRRSPSIYILSKTY